MNKFMNEHLKNINNEQENFNKIKSRIVQKKKKRLKSLNIAAVLLIIVLLGVSSPQIYAKVKQNIKYKEYTRRNYVSGNGEIASAYSENIKMDYVYQNGIGIKVDSIVLTDDSFKANINLKLPEEMRVDKLPENNNDDTSVIYQFGYAVYDENNNILNCLDRIDEKIYNNSGWFTDYSMCLYQDLGIKYNPHNFVVRYLAQSSSMSPIEKNDNNIITQLRLNSVEGFPNSKKIYIRIFNVGYYIAKLGGNQEFSKHSDLEWIFEIETPDKFIKRETINLVLLDEIPKLNINLFTVSETGMILKGQKKEIVKTMADGKDIENWGEVSDALINITDDNGNIYYPVQGGTTLEKNGFYSRFEIDKDLFEQTTLYLNMKIGEKEYTSEIAKDYD